MIITWVIIALVVLVLNFILLVLNFIFWCVVLSVDEYSKEVSVEDEVIEAEDKAQD